MTWLVNQNGSHDFTEGKWQVWVCQANFEICGATTFISDWQGHALDAVCLASAGHAHPHVASMHEFVGTCWRIVVTPLSGADALVQAETMVES